MIIKYNNILFEKICVFIGSLFGAYYLMNCVNEITLSTDVQRIFIVIYFFVLLVISSRIMAINIINKKKLFSCRTMYTISMLAMMCILCLGRHSIIPHKYEENQISIISLHDKNQESQGYETWISQIKLGNENIDLSEVAVNSHLWEFRDGAMYTNGENTQNIIMINDYKGRGMDVSFEKHAWSGMVLVETDQSTTKYDLYAPISETLDVTVFPQEIERTFIDKTVLLLGAIMVSYQMILLFMIILRYFVPRNFKNT